MAATSAWGRAPICEITSPAARLAIRPDDSQLFWQVGGEWVEQSDPVPWRGRVGFNRPGANAGQTRPDILFLSNGQSTAFTISFAGGECENDGWTGLRCADR